MSKHFRTRNSMKKKTLSLQICATLYPHNTSDVRRCQKNDAPSPLYAMILHSRDCVVKNKNVAFASEQSFHVLPNHATVLSNGGGGAAPHTTSHHTIHKVAVRRRRTLQSRRHQAHIAHPYSCKPLPTNTHQYETNAHKHVHTATYAHTHTHKRFTRRRYGFLSCLTWDSPAAFRRPPAPRRR